MRTILFALAIAASLPVLAQKKAAPVYPDMPVNAETKLITYEGVGEVAGVSAKELYGRALEWAKGHYKNPAEKLRKQDEENGELEIFNRFPIYAYDKKTGTKTTSQAGLIQYTLTIKFRDGRYRYELSKLNLKAQSYQPIDSWLLDKENDPNADNHVFQLADIHEEITASLQDLKAKVASGAKAKKDDW